MSMFVGITSLFTKTSTFTPLSPSVLKTSIKQISPTFFSQSYLETNHSLPLSIKIESADNLKTFDLHEETLLKATITYQAAKKLIELSFTDSIENESFIKKTCFKSQDELEKFLKKFPNVTIWEIDDHRQGRTSVTIYKKLNIQGELEDFSSLNSIYKAIIKEHKNDVNPINKISFKIRDKKTGETSYILANMGWFHTSFSNFSDQYSLLEAIEETIESNLNKHSIIKKMLTAAGTVAATAATYYVARSFIDYTKNTDDGHIRGNHHQVMILLTANITAAAQQAFSSGLQSLTNQIFPEESYYSDSYYTEKYFISAEGNPITVSGNIANTTTLPGELSVTNLPMSKISSLSFPGANAVAWNGGNLYVGTSSGLRIINYSSQQLVPLSFLATSNKAVTGFELIDNDTGIATTYTYPSHSLSTISISNSINPTILDTISLEIISSALIYKDNYSFIVGYNPYNFAGTLKIVDVNNHSNITAVSTYSNPSTAYNSIQCIGSICYLGSDLGVDIIDVSDVSNPTLTSSLVYTSGISNVDVLGTTIYMGTSSDGVHIYDASNSTQAVYVGTIAAGQSVSNIKVVGNHLFLVNQQVSFEKYSLADPFNPVRTATMPISAVDMAASDDNYFLLDNTGLTVTNLGPTFTLQGNAGAGTKGNYTIDFTGTSTSGSATKTMNVEIKEVVQTTGNIGLQKAVVGTNFNLYVGSYFKQLNNQFLTFTATLANGQPLPSWLTLNPTSGILSGVANGADIGNLNIAVTATDSEGSHSATTFQMNVIYGPTVNIVPSTQLVVIGSPFTYTFPNDTIIDKDGNPLAYTIKVTNGAWLTKLDNTTNTISGVATITDTGITTVTLEAVDPTQTSTSVAMNLNVVSELPPTLNVNIAQQTVSSRSHFSLVLAQNTFTDPYSDTITYSMTLGDGSSLDNTCFSFNPETLEISGNPGLSDAGFYAARTYVMTLTAKGLHTSASTNFNINVDGWSWGQVGVTLAGAAVSVLATTYGLYKKRVELNNWLIQRKVTNVLLNRLYGATSCFEYSKQMVERTHYKKPLVIKEEGEDFEYTASLPLGQLDHIQTWNNGKILPGKELLPRGFEGIFEENKLVSKSLPNSKNGNNFTFQFFDHAGYLCEEFELKINAVLNQVVVDNMQERPATPSVRTSSASSPGIKYRVPDDQCDELVERIKGQFAKQYEARLAKLQSDYESKLCAHKEAFDERLSHALTIKKIRGRSLSPYAARDTRAGSIELQNIRDANSAALVSDEKSPRSATESKTNVSPTQLPGTVNKLLSTPSVSAKFRQTRLSQTMGVHQLPNGQLVASSSASVSTPPPAFAASPSAKV